jgi:lipopolysaccharide export system permease protein
MLNKIDRYILRKFFGTYFVVLLSFVIIAVVFDITEKLDDFITGEASFGSIVVDYYFNFIPYYAILLTPLLLFLSIVFFTSRMTSSNEIIAILNTGIRYERLLKPYLIGAAIVCGINIYMNHNVLPITNKNRILFEDNYIRNHYVKSENNVRMQIAKNTYMYLQNYNGADSSGFKFTVDKWDNGKLIYKLRADRIKWINTEKKWKLVNYQIRKNGKMFESLRFARDTIVAYNFSPEDFDKDIEEINALTTAQINSTIESETLKGADNIPFYYIEKYKRTAFPFAIFILTVIAVSISTRKVRGGTGLHLFLGIALSFTYILFQQFFSVFSTNAGLPIIIGVCSPNILYGIVAIILYKIAPK